MPATKNARRFASEAKTGSGRHDDAKRMGIRSCAGHAIALCLVFVVACGARTSHAAGQLDSSYQATLGPAITRNGTIFGFAVQPDGKVIAAGSFNRAGGVVRQNIVRFNADGSVDSSFDAGALLVTALGSGETVSQIVIQTDGKILLVTSKVVVRLNADGSIDNSFNVTFDFAPNLQFTAGNTKLFAYGSFTKVNGMTRAGVVRLNLDGSIDGSFAAVQLGGNLQSVNRVFEQPNGSIILYGFQLSSATFTSINGVARKGLARLNSDGTLDTSFDPVSHLSDAGHTPPSIRISAIAVQPDNKLVLGGAFTAYDSSGRDGILRLNADGSLDTTFGADVTFVSSSGTFSGTVDVILLQPDSKLLIYGYFKRGQRRAT